MKKVGNMKLYSFGKRAADGRNGGLDGGKWRSERGKSGADGGFRGG